MATAYLIGGTPRCGKTSIALSAVTQHPMFSTSTDSIRHVLKQIISTESEPYLFEASERFTQDSIIELCSEGKASEIISWQNNESKVVWKSVKSTIEGFINEDLDILIEGVAILPEFILDLSCNVRTIFIGNSSADHGASMLNYARSGNYDWMSNYSDEAILQFGTFTSEFSAYIAGEATKYGYDYFDMSTGTYLESQHNALRALISDDRSGV